MLQVQHLTKKFSDDNTALDNVNFHIKNGEFVAVLGPSGSGKSTLFQCIIRLVEPTVGNILIDGEDVLRLKGRSLKHTRQKIGVIFQQYNLTQRLTAIQNVLAGRLPYLSTLQVLFRAFTQADRELALSCLDRVGLLDIAEQRADLLSGGQQQRIAVARALAQKPLLLLADEPVSNLDPQSAIRVMDVLKSINQEEGITIVCNLHQPDLAMKYADRIIGFHSGRVVVNQEAQFVTTSQIESIYDEKTSILLTQ